MVAQDRVAMWPMAMWPTRRAVLCLRRASAQMSDSERCSWTSHPRCGCTPSTRSRIDEPDAVSYAALLARVDDVTWIPTLDGCIYDRHTVFERMLEHVGHRLSPAQSKVLRELHERMKHGSRPQPGGS